MSQKSKTSDSKASSMGDSDLKGCSNYEALFDSGYNSNMQSSSFLELDSQTSITSDLASGENLSHSDRFSRTRDSSSKPDNKSKTIPQWSDSGLSIPDSGLGIVEDETHHEQEEKFLKKSAQSSIDPNKELLKSWLANNHSADA